ncbi:hypothetical protein [Francisella philomiragia]|uniref:hypothetical protein n=1 Tax=Francisella philomiragia TaxID=28110 RepID=UPI00351689A7
MNIFITKINDYVSISNRGSLHTDDSEIAIHFKCTEKELDIFIAFLKEKKCDHFSTSKVEIRRILDKEIGLPAYLEIRTEVMTFRFFEKKVKVAIKEVPQFLKA